MSSRYCVDCKHVVQYHPFCGGHRCIRPESDVPDPVTGKPRLILGRCSDERQRGWFRDTCGPDGKYWEAKA